MPLHLLVIVEETRSEALMSFTEPDKPEDITDLEILLNPLKSRIAKRKWDVMNPAHVEAVKSIKNSVVNKAF